MVGVTPLLDSIAAARRAGLVLTRKPDGQLVIRGPREHEQLVRSLLDRKHDVLAVLAVYTGDARCLDWRHARVLADMQPCVLCQRPSLLIEPYDGRPCHKMCAEAAIRSGAVPAMRRRAA